MYIDPSLHIIPTKEFTGKKDDILFLADDVWLQNSEVKYAIKKKKGRWYVYMIFFALKESRKLLIKEIDHYHSLKRAETFASIFQRGIRKDARGTLKRMKHDYDICNN